MKNCNFRSSHADISLSYVSNIMEVSSWYGQRPFGNRIPLYRTGLIGILGLVLSRRHVNFLYVIKLPKSLYVRQSYVN